MPSKFINSLWAATIVGANLPVHLACQGEKPDKIMEMTRRMDTGINFYGRVLDDQGKPVEGAEVLLHISRFGPVPTAMWTSVAILKLVSDDKGNFSIQGERGRSIYIADIKRNHYDNAPFKNSNTERCFYFDRELHVPFIPDPKNPIIYHLRKKGPEAFLLKGGIGFDFTYGESGTYKGKDFFRIPTFPIKEGELVHPTVYGKTVVCDLRAQATLDEKHNTWTVVLAPGNPDGGIQSSDQFLREAPATGYQQNLTFIVEGKAPKNIQVESNTRVKIGQKYIYLRSRKESIYSRIDMGEFFQLQWRPSPRDPKAFISNLHFSASATFNPYGDRILEEATDLPGDVRLGLMDEIDQAYHQKKRPRTPDLKKLIQDWEKTHTLPSKDKRPGWFKK